jgi:hypothetical protein
MLRAVAGLSCALAAVDAAAGVERARWEAARAIPLWIEQVNVPEERVEMVRRAAWTWSRASDFTLRFAEVEEFPSTGIRVRFIRDDVNFGEAVPHVERDTGRIVRADVVLLLDPPGDRLRAQLVVYLSALHELGHALGLAHAEVFGDIMYQFRSPADPERFFLGYRKRLRSADDIGTAEASGLTTRDVQALRALYAP